MGNGSRKFDRVASMKLWISSPSLYLTAREKCGSGARLMDKDEIFYCVDLKDFLLLNGCDFFKRQ